MSEAKMPELVLPTMETVNPEDVYKRQSRYLSTTVPLNGICGR